MENLKINICTKHKHIPPEIIEATNGDIIAAKILYGRGFDSAQKIKDFLFMNNYIPVQTQDIPEMKKAVVRIHQAINKSEPICIYGDYDVDGVTSTAILFECLQELNANCMFHVPDRFSEGYGMNSEIIKSLASEGIKLIITCDCGISNIEEIDLANQLGIDVIVTDHHSVPVTLPKAFCIINFKLYPQNYKAYNVSGAVVAYYLAKALFEFYGFKDKAEKFLDLVSLSIIADAVPLIDENRYLLKKGLPILYNSPRPGLKSLFTIASRLGTPINEEFIEFQIVPRLNAAGRIDTARKAVDLLITVNEDEANILSQELNNLNMIRKEIESEISKKAEELLSSFPHHKNIIVLYNENWHHGVIGIVAGKLCEKYNKPTILLSLKEDGTTVVGSARAPEGISIYNILQECDKNLLTFGGHDAAAGLSLNLSNLYRFIHEVETIAQKYQNGNTKTINVDLELEFKDINQKLIETIKKLSPFGEGFPPPIFFTKNVSITSNQPIKNIGRKMFIADNSIGFPAVYWRNIEFDTVCETVDIIFNLHESYSQGNVETRLNILHVIQPDDNKKVRKLEYKPIEILDFRNQEEFFKNYSPTQDEIIYFEGITRPFAAETFNRYELKPTENLILYSTPPSLEILKQILRKVMPKRLIIVFEDSIDSPRLFIEKAAGLIKHIVNHKEGKTSYNELTSYLCTTFEIIDLVLKFLYSLGFVTFEESEENLILFKGKSHILPYAEKYKKALVRALEETNSFKKFMKTTNLEAILKLSLFH